MRVSVSLASPRWALSAITVEHGGMLAVYSKIGAVYRDVFQRTWRREYTVPAGCEGVSSRLTIFSRDLKPFSSLRAPYQSQINHKTSQRLIKWRVVCGPGMSGLAVRRSGHFPFFSLCSPCFPSSFLSSPSLSPRDDFLGIYICPC